MSLLGSLISPRIIRNSLPKLEAKVQDRTKAYHLIYNKTPPTNTNLSEGSWQSENLRFGMQYACFEIQDVGIHPKKEHNPKKEEGLKKSQP